jgi:hypothetical protein
MIICDEYEKVLNEVKLDGGFSTDISPWLEAAKAALSP